MSRTESTESSARLSADDFIRVAFDIMLEEGIGGVKIQRLCDRLGVTKGSFYWHFADIDAFHSEIARRWAEDGAQLPDERQAGETINTMVEAMKLFADPRNRNLARAMRDWAQNDERARQAIRKADEALYEGVRDAFSRIGFSEADAALRAKILVYTGIGFAHVGPLGDGRPAQAELLATWELLSRR